MGAQRRQSQRLRPGDPRCPLERARRQRARDALRGACGNGCIEFEAAAAGSRHEGRKLRAHAQGTPQVEGQLRAAEDQRAGQGLRVRRVPGGVRGQLRALVGVLCQLQLWRWARQGRVQRPKFRLPGTPYTSILTLVFLVGVVVLMAFSDDENQRLGVAGLLILIPALVIGWFVARKKVLAIAAQREGYTGQFPVVANRPIEETLIPADE